LEFAFELAGVLAKRPIISPCEIRLMHVEYFFDTLIWDRPGTTTFPHWERIFCFANLTVE
jgi:hypothetical protein